MDATIEKTLPGASLPWLQTLRSKAQDRFNQLGFPTTKLEAWRFTPVDPIARTAFQTATRAASLTKAQIQGLSVAQPEDTQLVFADGYYAPELSTLPKNAAFKVGALSEQLTSNGAALERYLGHQADAETQAFTALNTARFADGAYLSLSKGAVVETPIHLLFVSATAQGQSHPRVLIVAESGSKASVIENYVSLSEQVSFTNAVTEIVVEENAKLDHYKIERQALSAFNVTSTFVRQARNSTFASHAILLGGAIVRNNIHAILDDEGADCTMNGLYMVTGKQLVDSHTLVDHVKPHGTSRQVYKGVLDQTAQAVFDGHVIVRANAQKTDSSQSNKNLLLSNEAKVNTKPELKIFANDVKCKHGATIGQIEPTSLFYLRSRGIPKEEARRLLIQAFASEMIARIELPALREKLREILEGRNVRA